MVKLSSRDVEMLRRLEGVLAPATKRVHASQATSLRVALPTAAMAGIIALALAAWPLLHRDTEVSELPTPGPTTIGQRDPVDIVLAHQDAREAERLLRAEFAEATSRKERAPRWFEDDRLLTYRSPWRPR
jgi:hypothetical protein